jgi:single-stranded-DNA-specific exonuclease
MEKNWKVNPINKELVGVLGRELNVSPLMAQLLINRGLVDTDRAFSFLSPDLKDLKDPYTMLGMERAVTRIQAALGKGEKIAIYGDYDVDGATSTALLKLFFAELGTEVLTYIPERLTEGYGLNKAALLKLSKLGAKLIITVDCGISDNAEVDYAGELGMDFIITDHHEVHGDVPQAHAVLNPKQPGCEFEFKGLAGVGVAFNLVMALRTRLRDEGFFKKEPPRLRSYLDIVAIGTVADMVPLVEENRIMVSYGVEELNKTGRPGLLALKDVSGLRGRLTAENIAFQLAPRLNAAGRLSSAEAALNLLLTDDTAEALRLANTLEVENTERRSIERRILDEAFSIIDGTEVGSAVVLAEVGWHPGVVGIVASRMVDRFFRPAVMIAIDAKTKECRGSVRGIRGVNVLEGLDACSDMLITYGGHKAAAGLSIEFEKIAEFREAFNAFMAKAMSESDIRPEVELDALVELDEIDAALIDEIERLSPFGFSNRQPILGAKDADIIRADVVGQRHLKIRIRQNNGKAKECIAFGMADKHPIKGPGFDVAFYPYIDEWRGEKNLRLRIKDLQKSTEV